MRFSFTHTEQLFDREKTDYSPFLGGYILDSKINAYYSISIKYQ